MVATSRGHRSWKAGRTGPEPSRRPGPAHTGLWPARRARDCVSMRVCSPGLTPRGLCYRSPGTSAETGGLSAPGTVPAPFRAGGGHRSPRTPWWEGWPWTAPPHSPPRPGRRRGGREPWLGGCWCVPARPAQGSWSWESSPPCSPWLRGESRTCLGVESTPGLGAGDPEWVPRASRAAGTPMLGWSHGSPGRAAPEACSGPFSLSPSALAAGPGPRPHPQARQ